MKPGNAVSGLAVLFTMLGTAGAGDRVLRTEMVVAAPIDHVWAAWATEEGVKTFFAPGAALNVLPAVMRELAGKRNCAMVCLYQ